MIRLSYYLYSPFYKKVTRPILVNPDHITLTLNEDNITILTTETGTEYQIVEGFDDIERMIENHNTTKWS